VRKGEDDLRNKLNLAINAIREDGTYQTINAKYFDFDIFGEPGT
jgi:polar amino acid transport system substrate-binding protein